jgi:hypothetical protein
MAPLAKLWTWLGHLFIPIAVVWAIYLRGGLADKPPAIGVSVSRGYWGMVITLAAAALLLWTCALYIKEAKMKGKTILIPPNTTFEDGNQRSLFVSWGTACVFSIAVAVALAIFAGSYSDSVIYEWTSSVPVDDRSFWASRSSAHAIGCSKKPCFAVQRRNGFSENEINGVHEYLLYFTDGAIAVLVATCLAGLVFLIWIACRYERATFLPQARR